MQVRCLGIPYYRRNWVCGLRRFKEKLIVVEKKIKNYWQAIS